MVQTVSNEDLASMVVTLSADLSKYQKEMSKVAGIAERAMKGAENAVVDSNDKMSRSHKKTADDAIRANRAAGASAANMGAQFQDVAVQLQSGTSPLTVAVQQGQQLAAVLNQVKASGGSLIGALGGAVGAFINPITVGTVLLIAAAGYAVQYFTSLKTGGSEAHEALMKHLDDLSKIADQYKGLSPAVDDAIETINRLKAAGEAADNLKKVNDELKALQGQITSTARNLGGNLTDVIDLMGQDAGNAFRVMTDGISASAELFESGSISAEQFNESVTKTLNGLESLGRLPDPIQKLVDRLRALSKTAIDTEAMRRAYTDLGAAIRDTASADVPAFTKAMDQLRAIGVPAITDAVKAMQAYGEAVNAARGNQDLLNQAAGGLSKALGTLSANALVNLQSTASGMDDIVKVIAQIESGTQNLGVHDAAKSTASGLFGFINSTFIGAVRSMGDEFKKMSDQDILKMKSRVDIQIAAAKVLTEANQRLLANAGQAVNDVNTVMSHWLGSGGALDVLRNVGKGTTGKQFLGEATIRTHSELADLDAEGILALVQKKIDAAAKARGIKLKVDAELDTSSLDKAIRSLQENTSELIAGAKANNEYSEALDQKVFNEELATKTQDLLNIATRDGKTATDDQRAAIDAAATAYANAKGHTAAYADELRNTKVWQDALKEADKDYAKSLGETAKTQQQVAQQYAQMGTQFITTFTSGLRQGKSATEALTDALVNLADQLLSMALNQALTSLFSQFKLPALGQAIGGPVGGPGHSRRVSPYAFLGAPRMASGGFVGVRPGEFPTLLHKGEVVIPARLVRQAARMGSGSSGGGSSSVSVGNISVATNIDGTGDVKADSQRGREMGLQIKSMITMEIQRQSRPGGLLTAQGSGFRVGR